MENRAWQVMENKSGQGRVRQFVARQGVARQDVARKDKACLGKASRG
jgi:hypothetical protein